MNVFITGITGTLGTELARQHRDRGDRVVGCARSEAKCAEWLRSNTVNALYVRDAKYIDYMLQLEGIVHRVYNCAAVKHVDLCEQNVAEAVEQNVDLVDTVSLACLAWDVQLVHVSTDKAYDPRSVYGATKLIAERTALQRGFAAVRLGNLIGSSGSVFQLWKRGPIRLTHPDMTRFFLPVREAAAFLMGAKPGLSYPTMKAARMGDIAAALGEYTTTGLRPGETMHQSIADGVCSDTAERWDIAELLKEAGL